MNRQVFWESSRVGSCPAWLWWLGVVSLLAHALFQLWWPAVGEPAGSVMALLGLIVVLWFGKGLRSSAALWLLWAAVAVQLLSWSLGYLHHPDWVPDNPQLDRLAKLFIFIAIAWWLGGSTRNTLLVWGLALGGYLAATLVQGEGLQEWLAGLQGQRVGFGIRNLQHGSMLFGVALLGVVVLAPRFMAPGKLRPLRVLLWVVLVLVCLTAVAIGQTRAVWLALAMALPAAGGLWLACRMRRRSERRHAKPLLLVGALLALGLLALGGLAFQETLKQRVMAESQVIDKLVHGEIESLPYSSIGIRIHSWRAALEWIEERPLVGWGGEGRSLVIDHTAWLPEHVKEEFGHLHNFFLEVWVAYGLLGLVLIGILAVWVGMGTWKAWRSKVMPNDIALFGAAFFIYWMIVNQFESYNSFGTGVYVHNLVVGGLVTHIWRWQWKTGQRVFPAFKPKASP